MRYIVEIRETTLASTIIDAESEKEAYDLVTDGMGNSWEYAVENRELVSVKEDES